MRALAKSFRAILLRLRHKAQSGVLRAFLSMLDTRYHHLAARAPEAIIVHADGQVIFANPACAAIFGADSPDRLVGRPVLDLIHPGSRAAIARRLQLSADLVDTSFHKEQLVAVGGGVVEAEVAMIPFTNLAGRQRGAVLIHDITAYKQMEAALRASEHRFRSVVEHSYDGILLIDSDGVVIYWNPASERITGLKQHDAVGRPIWDVMAQSLGRPATAQIAQILKAEAFRWLGETDANWTGRWVEQVFRRADGRQRIAQVLVLPIQTETDDIGCVIIRDVTEQRQTQQALEKRSRALQSLHEVMLEVGAELSLTALLGHIAERATALIDADKGGSIFLYHPGKHVLRLEAAYGVGAPHIGMTLNPGEGITGRVFETRQPFFVNDYPGWDRRIAFPDKITFSAVLAVPLLQQDQALGVLLLFASNDQRIFTDEDVWLATMFAAQAVNVIVNARLYQKLEQHSERLEEAVRARTAQLQQAKERTETILNSSPDAILLLRNDGAIDAFNPAFSKFFGHRLDDVYGQTPVMLVDPVHATDFSRVLRVALEQGEPGQLEVTAWRQDGTTFDAGVAFAPIARNGAVTGVICTFRDISSLKEVERMKDVFVSNVSHELRTPIASIRLYHDLLMRSPDNSRRYMEHLQRETDRLQRIIEDLLFLSRLDQEQTTLRCSPVDLNELAAQYIADRVVLADQRKLRLSFEALPGLPLMELDRGLIGQALSILLTNALNYTPAGGKVTVRARADSADDQWWAGLEVNDTGPGIPLHEQPRLFERFFRGSTARESGMPGTGLGLALVKEIVSRHGGWVDVISTGVPGEGATFCLWLPAGAPDCT
ncbi:MAG: PAS domain S-box protein [Anaerolineae bacterium]|nr:PAS domain S-box protein [Anaerolineae bacterium]